ncbi:B12-binding domain-containing radical SAM protein [Treponema sp. C6A8]|uniref:B12-binding domain-containing radical SAM protein n=1 Tax=Treponema sp. C6A8 TaxID=1410609 RepID=UPI0006859009|nr:B12-binding domain-containing radical SAM protein [Treponema sp. C6A8]
MKPLVICTTLLVEKSPQALPLGAACIASAIKQSQLTRELCEVKLTAFSMEDKVCTADSIYRILIEEKPAIVCFSVFVWNRLLLEEVSEKLRAEGIITIAGGPEITAHPEVFTSFDYTVSGEGEIKVPELVAKLISGAEDKTKPAKDGNPLSCILTTSQIDLASLSSPYLDGTIDPSEYGGALWELARGCPFKCSYCYESKGSKTVRLFPMERIRAELELFAAKKIPQVFVLDPTYNANKERALQILKLMAQKTPDTFYYFEARAEFITPELARAFTKIPCAVQIGLQSANPDVLALVHRPFNKKQFTKNIAILNREGVIFGFDLIYGLPGETLRGFKEGIDFAISLYPNNLELFCLSVLPGTDLFDRAGDLHLTFEPQPPYHIIHTDLFSKEDISRAASLSAACDLFYNQGRAVPWFNTICHAAKIRPSQFFAQFADHLNASNSGAAGNGPLPNLTNLQHPQIEKLQLDFIKKLFDRAGLQRLFSAAKDLISLNGALARTQESGRQETLRLSYNAEYLFSEYAGDLKFFCQNVKPQPCKIQTFMNGHLADFRVIK